MNVAANGATKMRVLVADDDDFFRMALQSILTMRLGFKDVVETASFDEALQQIGEGERFDLAIFDLAMPGMAGAASLAAVREFAPALKVAVVSASEGRQTILDVLAVGVHGYVPKSLGVPGLTQALRMIVDGSIFVPASLADIPSLDATGGFDEAPSKYGALPPLTLRQAQILDLIIRGASNKEICRDLSLSEGTVKIHVAALLRALGVRNRTEAAALGSRMMPSLPAAAAGR